jgi:hypothetical protein
MLSADFYKFDQATRQLVFSFPILIPVTDLGEGALLLIDLDGRDSVTKVLP